MQPWHGQRRAWTKVSSLPEPKGRGTAGPEFWNRCRSKGPLSRKSWCCSPLSPTPNPRSGGRFNPRVLSKSWCHGVGFYAWRAGCPCSVTEVILPTVQERKSKPSVTAGQELSKVPLPASGRTRIRTRSDLVYIPNKQATAWLPCREKLRAVGTQRKVCGAGEGEEGLRKTSWSRRPPFREPTVGTVRVS